MSGGNTAGAPPRARARTHAQHRTGSMQANKELYSFARARMEISPAAAPACQGRRQRGPSARPAATPVLQPSAAVTPPLNSNGLKSRVAPGSGWRAHCLCQRLHARRRWGWSAAGGRGGRIRERERERERKRERERERERVRTLLPDTALSLSLSLYRSLSLSLSLSLSNTHTVA